MTQDKIEISSVPEFENTSYKSIQRIITSFVKCQRVQLYIVLVYIVYILITVF
jgi:hypothetical protein